MDAQKMILVLGILLIPFGGFRIYLSRRGDARNPRHHLIAGIAFICMGIFLILSSRGLIPFGTR